MEAPPENVTDFLYESQGVYHKAAVEAGGTRYIAKFQLAKSTTEKRKPSEKPLANQTIKSIFTRDEVLNYLAPHEILNLWRTNKNCQLIERKRRLTIMMHSVFTYLRISKETADHVQRAYIGGWKSFLPRLVSMCEYLASKVYGDLEPDLAHRVFIAEQACFGQDMEEPHGCMMGELASFQTGQHMRNQLDRENNNAPRPVPTLEVMMRVGCDQIGWGNPLDWGHPAYREGFPEFLEENRQWIQKQATLLKSGQHEEYNKLINTAAPPRPTKRSRGSGSGRGRQKRPPPNPIEKLAKNEHIQNRLIRGLHPAIWISYQTHMEPTEELFVVGPNLEQIRNKHGFSSYYDYDDMTVESFAAVCPFFPGGGDEEFEGGIVDYLVNSPCCSPQGGGRDPTLGICIWCPIQWKAVIDSIEGEYPPVAKYYKRKP